MAERLFVERLGAAGDGVAAGPEGPAFVPYGLPGETILAERTGTRWRALSIEEPSPDRAEPFCPHFGTCGGCVAQHMAPALYRGWKEAALAAALDRAGIARRPEPLVDAGGEGRRRVTFHGRIVDGRMQVGFMEARSHRLVPVERCPVAEPALDGAAPAATALATVLAGARKPLDIAVTASEAGLDVDLRGSGPPGEAVRQQLVDAAVRLDLARLSLAGELLVERRAPEHGSGPARIVPPPGGFLQATRAGEDALGEAVLAAVGPAKRVLDLFAGSGPFTLRLARRAEVHAVEGDRAAIAALERAARRTPGLKRVTTECRDLFRRPLLPPEVERFSAVVLDPPRAGAEAQVRQLILSSAETVILVSCDPGTFARDAAVLAGAGFAVERVLPVDQFRWSAHLEVVGVFRRARPRPRRR